MASPGGASANDDLRGRSNLPKRGEITYSSLRLRVPSQERPLHISPDRITRHASPGRANRLADEQEVVPRIPQPYRTSFSAVTSPRRVPRPANLAPLDRACPFRSTMPGRITSPPERKPNYTFQSYDHRRGASKYSLDSRNAGASGTKAGQNHNTNGAKLASQSAENVLNGAKEEAKMSVPPGYSEPDLNINKSLVNGDESVRAFMSNGTIQTQQTDESDVISNTLESTDFTDGGTSPEPQMFTFEVEAKKLITREYVHVNDISYFKALDKKAKLPTPNEETERIVANMMRGKKREWQLMSPRTHREQHAGMSLPTSPDESPKLRPQRSGTLPSETLLAGKPMASTPVKRSLSTSITNFFRRMSPKSLRRSSKGSQKSKTTATPDSSTNSLQAVFCDSADDLSQDSDHSGAHNKGKGKSPKSPKASPIRNLLSQSFRKSKEKISHTNPTSASSSKEANLSKEALSPSPLPGGPDDNPSPSSSPQVLSTDSARILKSIENNSQVVCEKNVYHAFKEKQSPKRMNEAMSMKPQALKAVEFPDQYLNVSDKITQSDTSIDNVDNNAQSVPSHLDTTDNANIRINEELTKVASLPGTLDRHSKKKEPISSASGMLLLPKGDAQGGVIRRANDPPKTLDVREVAKLQKAVFMFPNMSAESIGQCSVNLYTSGSEPSLLSRNGQRSSTTASKRTLVSQDPSPPHHHTNHKVDGEHRSSSQPTLLDSDHIMPGTTDPALDPSIDTTPKTPSYMKISCALSGYNRYNTYTSPKQEAKLKVIKLSEQNGSHSSLSSQSDCSSSAAEVRNNSDLSIKVADDLPPATNHQLHPVMNQHEPMKNGHVASERLQNGNSSNQNSSINGSGGGATTNGADRQPVAIVTNGRTTLDDDDQDDDRFVTMTTVNLQPSGSPTSTSLTTPLANKTTTSGTTTSGTDGLKLQWEDKRKTDLRSAVSTPSPSKDGHYYFPVLDREVTRIRGLCALCEQDMQNNALPEEVSGKLRATIGKSNLLVDKKFQQFRGLCERNISQDSDEQFQTTVTDLAGFWDMVSLQISDINTMFSDVEKMRQSGWKIVKDSPVKQTTTKMGSKSAKTRTKDPAASSTPVRASSAKSVKASEAAKARDEARKRLLAAKRAGRQRKISESDKDEIEIFVAK